MTSRELDTSCVRIVLVVLVSVVWVGGRVVVVVVVVVVFLQFLLVAVAVMVIVHECGTHRPQI